MGQEMTLPNVAPRTILVISTEGEDVVFRTPPTIRNIETLIGAKTLEFIRIGKADGSDLVMAIDDRGYESTMVEVGDGRYKLQPVRALKPVNQRATELYHAICNPGTTHQIVGDVAIVHDEDFA